MPSQVFLSEPQATPDDAPKRKVVFNRLTDAFLDMHAELHGTHDQKSHGNKRSAGDKAVSDAKRRVKSAKIYSDASDLYEDDMISAEAKQRLKDEEWRLKDLKARESKDFYITKSGTTIYPTSLRVGSSYAFDRNTLKRTGDKEYLFSLNNIFNDPVDFIIKETRTNNVAGRLYNVFNSPSLKDSGLEDIPLAGAPSFTTISKTMKWLEANFT